MSFVSLTILNNWQTHIHIIFWQLKYNGFVFHDYKQVIIIFRQLK
jgi:hypothetical protein